jgi:hypothetical protein
LRAKAGEQALDDRQGPAPLEERFRGRVIPGFDQVLAFSVLERDHLPATAALLRPFTCQPVGQVVFQRRQKEHAESASVLTQPLEVLPLDARCQEPLGQVARIFRIETSAAEVGVERIPVGLAEQGERLARGLRVVPRSRQHETPPRRFEVQDDASYTRWSPLAT